MLWLSVWSIVGLGVRMSEGFHSQTNEAGGAHIEGIAVGAADEPRPAVIARRPGQWWVLHTRSRHEKRVADELQRRDVSCYLPLRRTSHAYAKSRAEFDVPLFPCYLFVHGGETVRETALRTNRVAQVLPVRDQAQLTTELSQIDVAISGGRAVDLYPRIREGERCRVTDGPLRGIEGVVMRSSRRCQVCLAVTMLGQAAAVEVDAGLLTPVET